MIANLWAHLPRVTSLTFIARSSQLSGWNGAGQGTVRIEQPEAATILFHECGTWRTAIGDELAFSNVFRWTLRGEWIRLEHLRFGPETPVVLFEIEAISTVEFSAVTPHICSQDLYAATFKLDGHNLLVGWTVIGPEKEERMNYTYSTAVLT